MIERLVPSIVSTAETREDILDIDLFPAEEWSIRRAVEKRCREFVTGRACARRALGQLCISPTAIPHGLHGEPLWPAGVVGTITHCPGYCACAVATMEHVASLGIDAEVNAPLPEGVLEQVAFGPEREIAESASGLCTDRLLFSAKEAIYKAWFPLAKRWLGFEDVELQVDLLNGTFCARLPIADRLIRDARLTAFRGRWCVEDGVICTAVTIS